MEAAQARHLSGDRLHLHHGPIDLVIGAFGRGPEVARGYTAATARFADILSRLVDELDRLRRPIEAPRWVPAGPVARRMMAACWAHREMFVTPMAAVAGAVADEILAAMVEAATLERAYVNNSGDIAFHLSPGATLSLGVVGDLHRPAIDGTARLGHELAVRGVATSGWRGRSLSLGIADAVTVLAVDAAAADVAATLIANAVDCDHPAIARRAARVIDPDSDLGDRPVTVAVGALDDAAIAAALTRGQARAAQMLAAGQIDAAMLLLQGGARAVGRLPGAIAA
jgi:uncharacterized protein